MIVKYNFSLLRMLCLQARLSRRRQLIQLIGLQIRRNLICLDFECSWSAYLLYFKNPSVNSILFFSNRSSISIAKRQPIIKLVLIDSKKNLANLITIKVVTVITIAFTNAVKKSRPGMLKNNIICSTMPFKISNIAIHPTQMSMFFFK